jgi:uncharacterized lipoprotein YmbA
MQRAVVAAAVLLAACASTPQIQYYSLVDFTGYRGPPPCVEVGSRSKPVIVHPFNVLPPFDTVNIAYRPPDLSQTIGFYASHHWALPQGRMLAEATADYLCQAGIDAELGALDERAGRSITVGADVSELLEVDTPEGPTGQVALTLRVENADGELIFEKQLWGRVPAEERTVDSVVKAMDEALEMALSEVRAPIERLVQISQSSSDSQELLFKGHPSL